MVAKTRYSAVGVAGGKGRPTNGDSDPFFTQVVIPLPLVAATAEQDTGVTLPAKASEFHCVVNVITASSAGTTETIDIGVTGNADALIDGGSTNAAGLIGRTGGAGESEYPANIGGTNITYALGSADIAGLEAELILTYIGAEV